MRENKFLGLPSFLLGVFILYWSLPLAALLNRIKFWKVLGKRDDAFGWCVRGHRPACSAVRSIGAVLIRHKLA